MKLSNRNQRSLRNDSLQLSRTQCIKEWLFLSCSKCDELRDSCFTDGASRKVYDAEQALLIVGISNNLQICKDIFDFLPLIEGDAANNNIRESVPSELILNRARLRVCSIENSKIPKVKLLFSRLFFYQTDDPLSLLFVVITFDEDDEFSLAILRPQPFIYAVYVLPDQ